MVKLIRVTTVPISMKILLKGQHRFMRGQSFDVIGVSCDGQELDDIHYDEGIKVVPLEMTRIISPLKDLKSLFQFYQLCRKERPLIVHSHTPKAGIVGMLGAKLAGVPIRLHTVAGLPLMEVKGLKRKVLNFVEKLTYSSASKVYPNSKGLYDFILNERFTKEEKLKVIGNGSSNGIDTSFFTRSLMKGESLQTLKSEIGIQKEDFVFVFVGRLVGDKGINELVHAFSKLQQETNKAIKLLLVGSLESELDSLFDSTLEIIKKNKNIISVGFQKDVRPYFAVSDVLVFPSYREGFPNVVMQAGAMELPSIVSNINGCNEIIEEGINGTIIPVKNTDAIRIAMLKLLEDKGYYQQLKANSRRMIAERYEQYVVWNALLDEYNTLIAQYEKSKNK